jgi:hypothetical protein
MFFQYRYILSVFRSVSGFRSHGLGLHQDLLFFKFQYVFVKLRNKEQCKQMYLCQFYYSGTCPKIEFTEFFQSKSRTLACFKTA